MKKLFTSTLALCAVAVLLFGQSAYIGTVGPLAAGGGSNNLCTDQPTAGAWTPTITASHTYCLAPGTYTLAAAVAINANNITVLGTGPGVVVQRTTSGNNAFTSTADDFQVENVTLTGNSGANGYAITNNGNRMVLKSVYTSGWGANSGNGIIRITGGYGHQVDGYQSIDAPSNRNIVFSSEDSDIYDVRVSNSRFQWAGDAIGALTFAGQTAGKYIYNSTITNCTFQGIGRGFYVLLSNTKPRNITGSNLDFQLTGDTTLDMFGVWGCEGCAWTGITGSDNNHGMSNQPFFAMHDQENSHHTAFVAKLLNVGSQCGQHLDTKNSSWKGFKCYGGGGNLNNSSNRGMFEGGIGASGSSDSGNSFEDIHIEMPSGATNIGVRLAIGAGSGDTLNETIMRGIYVKGGSSATGIALSTANGATFDTLRISDYMLSTLSTGISIGSNLTGIRVGSGQFKTVTTRISDSGTGTILEPIAVAEVTQTSKTTAITTATLFTPDADAQYRIGGSLNCDTTSAAATVNITIGWTDPSNQAQTATLGSAAACTALGAASFGSLNFPFRAKSGTNITYATSIVNTPTYDVSVHVEQVTTK